MAIKIRNSNGEWVDAPLVESVDNNTGAISLAEDYMPLNVTDIDVSGTLKEAGQRVYSPNNIPSLSTLGAAAASHNHSTGNITSGTLPVARGGTGQTSYRTELTVTTSQSTLTLNSASKAYYYPYLKIVTFDLTFSTNTSYSSGSKTVAEISGVALGNSNVGIACYCSTAGAVENAYLTQAGGIVINLGSTLASGKTIGVSGVTFVA